MKQSTILTCLTLTIALAACGPNEGAEESPPTADAESDSGPTETSLEGSTETGGASETGPEPGPDPEPAELCCSCADRACDVVTPGTCESRGDVAWQACDLGSDGACLDACGVCCSCDTLHWRDPLCEPATAGTCTGADNPGLAWCQPDAYGTLDDCRAACRVR